MLPFPFSNRAGPFLYPSSRINLPRSNREYTCGIYGNFYGIKILWQRSIRPMFFHDFLLSPCFGTRKYGCMAPASPYDRIDVQWAVRATGYADHRRKDGRKLSGLTRALSAPRSAWSIANTEGCLYGGDASSPVTSLRLNWLRYGTALFVPHLPLGLGFDIEKPLSMQAMTL